MFKNFKFLRNIIGLFFVGWLIFSPTPPDKNVPRYFGSINVAVQNNTQRVNKIILASSSRDQSDSDSDIDIETEGTVESDIEEDTQFLLPMLPGLSPEVLPIA